MEAKVVIKDDLKYTKEHEWLKLTGDVATMGITDYAQKELGDVVFVELPAVGREVEQMKSFGTIEAVKAVSDIFSPVSGKVTEPVSPLMRPKIRRKGLNVPLVMASGLTATRTKRGMLRAVWMA